MILTLGKTIYVPNPSRPRLSLKLRGQFSPLQRKQIESIAKSILVRKDLEIEVVSSQKDGFDRKQNQLFLNPESKVDTVLPQLVGIYFWYRIFNRQQRKAYSKTISGLPDALSPLKDFAVAFGKFWKEKLKQPRRQLLHAFLVKIKGPFEPRDLATQMGGPRNPKPERKNPVPSVPFTPAPDSQFR